MKKKHLLLIASIIALLAVICVLLCCNTTKDVGDTKDTISGEESVFSVGDSDTEDAGVASSLDKDSADEKSGKESATHKSTTGEDEEPSTDDDTDDAESSGEGLVDEGNEATKDADETKKEDGSNSSSKESTTTKETTKSSSKETTKFSGRTTAPTTQQAHTHSYSASVTKAATCTTAGVKTYKCSCGASYTESIPATGHNWVAQTKKVHHDAVTKTVHYDEVGHTEQEPIWEEYVVCNRCGGDFSINFHGGGHTCEDGGFSSGRHTDYRIIGYNDVYVVDTPAHDETVIVSEAYDETVTKGYKCSNCGATK